MFIVIHAQNNVPLPSNTLHKLLILFDKSKELLQLGSVDKNRTFYLLQYIQNAFFIIFQNRCITPIQIYLYIPTVQLIVENKIVISIWQYNELLTIPLFTTHLFHIKI